ncbi:unnamed protein product [Heterosigma akashiwo]
MSSSSSAVNCRIPSGVPTSMSLCGHCLTSIAMFILQATISASCLSCDMHTMIGISRTSGTRGLLPGATVSMTFIIFMACSGGRSLSFRRWASQNDVWSKDRSLSNHQSPGFASASGG